MTRAYIGLFGGVMLIPLPRGSMYGIFTYIWLMFMVNVGEYTSPMDPMGYIFPKVPPNPLLWNPYHFPSFS